MLSELWDEETSSGRLDGLVSRCHQCDSLHSYLSLVYILREQAGNHGHWAVLSNFLLRVLMQLLGCFVLSEVWDDAGSGRLDGLGR